MDSGGLIAAIKLAPRARVEEGNIIARGGIPANRDFLVDFFGDSADRAVNNGRGARIGSIGRINCEPDRPWINYEITVPDTVVGLLFEVGPWKIHGHWILENEGNQGGDSIFPIRELVPYQPENEFIKRD